VNYYKRHLGDYAKKAGKLSMLEHGAYTLLIDACYDRESFPTEDEAIEWCWARSSEEVDAVKFVLKRFFDLVDGKFVQKRIAEELKEYRLTCEINAKIATNRPRSNHGTFTSRPRVVDTVTTDRPSSDHLTNNHKPLTNNHKPLTTPISPKWGLDGFEKFWQAYPNKKSKGQAKRAWQKLHPTEQLLGQILAALDQAKTSDQWAKDNGRFIPHPSTWLNAEGWEDKHEVEVKAKDEWAWLENKKREANHA
jgi:uncharacterized protein YdaU (DUF1376 family)